MNDEPGPFDGLRALLSGGASSEPLPPVDVHAALDRMFARLWTTSHAIPDDPYAPIVVSPDEARWIEEHGGWPAVFDRAMEYLFQGRTEE